MPNQVSRESYMGIKAVVAVATIRGVASLGFSKTEMVSA